MKTIADLELERLSGAAQDSARRRMHLNIHTELNDPVQRLFAAWAPKEKIAQVAEVAPILKP